jgi:Resolvase, N terminal domain
VSFVSVTQQFNTSTSMGRLTLNVLLSFAQFEREVTSERIRDKIAASERKGLWVGGPLPLGYDMKERTNKPKSARKAPAQHRSVDHAQQQLAERLRCERDEAMELQAASAEVLKIISAYSITSSAAVSSAGERESPSVLAVFRFITSSNLVGCCIGNSAGFAPLRILSIEMERDELLAALAFQVTQEARSNARLILSAGFLRRPDRGAYWGGSRLCGRTGRFE